MANTNQNPNGLCRCGCGAVTALAKQTRKSRNQRKGQHVHFVNGAHARRAAAGTLAQRFWARVNKSDGCWGWKGKHRHGYAFLKVGEKSYAAHRLSVELSGREIPQGLSVLHSCDNPGCVNPAHLTVGTHQDNMTDMYTKGRRAAASGERNGRSKLTVDQVNAIRLSTRPTAELARLYRVSFTAVAQIRQRILWKGVA